MFHLQQLSHQMYESQYKWSSLQCFDNLKINNSGKVGEQLIKVICEENNIPVSLPPFSYGAYDLIILDKRVEIKTSKAGKDMRFQHEQMRQEGYDFLFFLDVCPEYFYLTILPKFDLTTKCSILNLTPHLRRGTNDVFKMSVTEKKLSLGNPHTLKITAETSTKVIGDFIYHHLTNACNTISDT